MTTDYFVIAECDHELQNPTSEEKLLLLGRRLGLGRESRVLDIASGRGGPAVLLASEFGCTIEGIELRPEFHAAALKRAESAGVSDRVHFELGDASQATFAADAYDVAMCLGASFIWHHFAGTVEALVPVVRPGGHVVVGEPYWREIPLPEDYPELHAPFTTLEDTVLLFRLSGLAAVCVIASSEDDWDRYETLHWQAVERWLAEHPDDPSRAEIRMRFEHAKQTYLSYGRDYMGWGIFAGWKRA